MENQNKSKSQGVLVTLCVLVVILIVVILYAANKPAQQQSFNDQVPQQTQVSPAVPETVSTPVKAKPTISAQSQTDTTANDLFLRRQACSQKLTAFEQYEQVQYQQLGSMNNFTLTNFVVGYSPSLQACIGGFNAASQPGGKYVGISSQYMIVNLDTYKTINDLPGSAYGIFMEDSNSAYPNHHYQDYLNALSNLTNGQIQ